jgi:hypothetical protein
MSGKGKGRYPYRAGSWYLYIVVEYSTFYRGINVTEKNMQVIGHYGRCKHTRCTTLPCFVNSLVAAIMEMLELFYYPALHNLSPIFVANVLA